MKSSFLALLLAAGLAIAAEPAKETPAAPAAPEPKPFFDPNAPAPTVDPTKPVPEPSIPAPEKKKPVVTEKKKKKKDKK
jgi:hypothetical protein